MLFPTETSRCLGENWFQSNFFPLQVFCFHVRMADVLRSVSECGEPVSSVPGGHVHGAAGVWVFILEHVFDTSALFQPLLQDLTDWRSALPIVFFFSVCSPCPGLDFPQVLPDCWCFFSLCNDCKSFLQFTPCFSASPLVASLSHLWIPLLFYAE